MPPMLVSTPAIPGLHQLRCREQPARLGSQPIRKIQQAGTVAEVGGDSSCEAADKYAHSSSCFMAFSKIFMVLRS